MRARVFAAWIAVAGVASAHGDLHDSIQAITLKLQKEPADPGLYLQRALLYAADEDPPKAHADFDRAEQLGADSASIAPGRAKLHLAAGNFAEACGCLDELILKEPRHVEALVTRARARARLAEGAGAVADYTAAIAASSRPEPDYYLERARVLCGTEAPQIGAAVRGLDEGLIRLGQGIVTLQLAALEIEIKAGRLDEALARIDTATAAAPRKELWLSRRGDLLQKAGRSEDARKARLEALKSISALPPHARTARATSALEAQLHHALTAAAR